jgi:hypothetical protein
MCWNFGKGKKKGSENESDCLEIHGIVRMQNREESCQYALTGRGFVCQNPLGPSAASVGGEGDADVGEGMGTGVEEVTDF